MNKSDGALSTSIPYCIYHTVLYDPENIDIESFITRFKSTTKRPTVEQSYGESSCIFAMSDTHTNWIDEMWDLIENSIFPPLNEAFIRKSRNGEFEKFYSGFNLTITDTSTSQEELPCQQ